MTKSINAIEDLIDLQTKLVKLDIGVDLQATLRIAPISMDHEGGQISISLKQATLKVEFDGLEPALDARYGEKTLHKKVTKYTEKKDVHGGIDGELGYSTEQPTMPKVKVSVNGVAGYSCSSEANFETEELNVRTMPGDKWLIKNHNNGCLDGTYLPKATMCNTTPIKGANRHASTSKIVVEQKDLNLKFEGSFYKKMSLTKGKMLAILLSKRIEENIAPYAGKITLCISEATCNLED